MNGDGTLTKREMLAAEEFTPEEVTMVMVLMMRMTMMMVLEMMIILEEGFHL